jgi:hypothetical protein
VTPAQPVVSSPTTTTGSVVTAGALQLEGEFELHLSGPLLGPALQYRRDRRLRIDARRSKAEAGRSLTVHPGLERSPADPLLGGADRALRDVHFAPAGVIVGFTASGEHLCRLLGRHFSRRFPAGGDPLGELALALAVPLGPLVLPAQVAVGGRFGGVRFHRWAPIGSERLGPG